MAVPKSKVSRSKRGQRRAHDHATPVTLSIDAQTGVTHRRHCVSEDGFYRGKPIFDNE